MNQLNRKLLVPLLALLLAVPTLAQEAAQDAAADTLAALQEEAQRLTILAEVPAAGRAEAETLLDRADALSERGRTLEISRLEAYVAALRNGDSAAVARELADAEVSQASVELTRERETLESDIEAFVETYPDAAAAFRSGLGRALALAGREAGVFGFRQDFGAGAAGTPFGQELRGDAWRSPAMGAFPSRAPGAPMRLMVPYGPDVQPGAPRARRASDDDQAPTGRLWDDP